MSKNVKCKCGIESIYVTSTDKTKDGKYYCIRKPPISTEHVGHLITTAPATAFVDEPHRCAD